MKLTMYFFFLTKISEYAKLILCKSAFVPAIKYDKDLKLKCVTNEQNPNGGISTHTHVRMQC